ncbi:hypothetical protein [Streptomyces sp. ALI-76-A]|uniref:hypothetical protein n=1 Tax=Streptomyces sp. ALI-76-A TaxID=3025736 RepID=UPI00256E9FC8|nr:hypothetical protein [Streptomyces sp. ALI-76-A]MDL5205159.1 hypothetical protein [Streptomyces sp. ALI-76-A]
MEKELLILLSEEGAEPERVADLTGYLREELLLLDVDDVTAVPGEELPPGARAVDVTQIGSLLVALGGSVTGLGQVVAVLRGWLGRIHGTRPSLRLTLDGDVLDISDASDEQVAQAFDLFVRRHAAGETRT